ncbi:ROK family protein [Tundrisphaera sp. TA3]|uniref:ROK family protein n=1 Tax=Tundrisphaera sp. TA3 TaxID=3435775 RepID=UPI003EB91AB1
MSPTPGPLVVGIEIGGTKLQLGLGRGDGRIPALERRTIRPEAGAPGILAQIEEAYRALLDRPEAGGARPEAVGIGFGGPVDAARGIVTHSHQVDGWDGFPLAEWAGRTLGVGRVAIQNDADTAGLGEALFGAGVGLDPILYVTIGSGIGGGLIVGGRIYRGAGSGAAEIGHVWVDGPDGPRILESIASGWSIGKTARDRRGDPCATAETVARSAVAGDAGAAAILAEAAEAVGTVLAHAVTMIAPRRIILGGGVSLIPDPWWIEPIRRRIDERAFPPVRGTFDVVTAALGESVVIHGALALARHALPSDEHESGTTP